MQIDKQQAWSWLYWQERVSTINGRQQSSFVADLATKIRLLDTKFSVVKLVITYAVTITAWRTFSRLVFTSRSNRALLSLTTFSLVSFPFLFKISSPTPPLVPATNHHHNHHHQSINILVVVTVMITVIIIIVCRDRLLLFNAFPFFFCQNSGLHYTMRGRLKNHHCHPCTYDAPVKICGSFAFCQPFFAITFISIDANRITCIELWLLNCYNFSPVTDSCPGAYLEWGSESPVQAGKCIADKLSDNLINSGCVYFIWCHLLVSSNSKPVYLSLSAHRQILQLLPIQSV